MEIWDPVAVPSARPLPPGQSAEEHIQQLEEVKIEARALLRGDTGQERPQAVQCGSPGQAAAYRGPLIVLPGCSTIHLVSINLRAWLLSLTAPSMGGNSLYQLLCNCHFL